MEKVKIGQVRRFDDSTYTVKAIRYDELTKMDWVTVTWNPGNFESEYPIFSVEDDPVLSSLELELL